MPTDSIDWAAIRERLPTEKTEEQKVKRKDLFALFDPNNNGYLSLAEVDRGCRDVLGLYQLFEAKKVIMRAFQNARGVGNANDANGSLGRDFVEKKEFRLLLVYLRQYFEIWQMFDQVETGNDHRINLEEFKEAIPKLAEWGVKVDDAETEFKVVDANGGGLILFDEFADWALKKMLVLEDEDPPESS
jgi:Ca2+-binding EF-hand superfamily protein